MTAMWFNSTQKKILAAIGIVLLAMTVAFFFAHFNARQPVGIGFINAVIRVFSSLNTVYGLFVVTISALLVWCCRTRRK